MASRSVVFRCDAGPRIGIGHVMRCVALAEELAQRGWSVTFVADLQGVPWALDQVASRGFAVIAPPSDDEAAALLAFGADWLILDSYLLPGSVYAELRDVGVRVLTFVDGDPTDRTGTVMLDQNIGAEADEWPLPADITRLAGLDFALMRSDIVDRRPDEPRSADAVPPKVFAFFGGTDAHGAGPVVTQALIDSGAPFDLRVVAATPWDERPHPRDGQTVTLIPPTDRLADEVLDADLVVSAAGTSSWELLCLGAACAFVCVADNQALAYGRAVGSELGIGLGMLDDIRADPSAASTALGDVLGSGSLRADLRARGWSRVDGHGRGRVVDVMDSVSAT